MDLFRFSDDSDVLVLAGCFHWLPLKMGEKCTVAEASAGWNREVAAWEVDSFSTPSLSLFSVCKR